MDETKRLLKIVTNEAIKSIEQLKIVTPTIYSSVFFQFAKEHKLELKDEEKISSELMAQECANLTDLQSETSKSTLKLSDSTSKAISAIKNKDTDKLDQVLQETESLRQEIEKLRESVYKDTLTGTFNRKWLHDNFMSTTSKQSMMSGVLAMIDLNYFKLINDTHGHVIGDKVLMFIANEFLKNRYPVIRYGGDEFIILFPDTVSEASASKTLADIRENILHKKFKAHNKTFTVCFSFGVQKFSQDAICADVLELADKKMYADKLEIKKRVTSI